MRNIFQQLKNILPDPPLLIGTVQAVDADRVVIIMPGGGTMIARSPITVDPGAKVFVRNSVVEGTAPDLPVGEIEI